MNPNLGLPSSPLLIGLHHEENMQYATCTLLSFRMWMYGIWKTIDTHLLQYFLCFHNTDACWYCNDILSIYCAAKQLIPFYLFDCLLCYHYWFSTPASILFRVTEVCWSPSWQHERDRVPGEVSSPSNRDKCQKQPYTLILTIMIILVSLVSLWESKRKLEYLEKSFRVQTQKQTKNTKGPKGSGFN